MHETHLAAKKKLNDAIQAARVEVWEIAKHLFQEFKVHDIRYFYNLIMQSAKKSSTERELNWWNAFLHMKNKEQGAAAQGSSKKAHELSSELCTVWAEMSKEEQIEITKDVMKELQKQRDMKKYAVQNMPIAAYHDVKSTLQCIEDEITGLYARMSMEFIVLGVRMNEDHYNQLWAFMTSDCVEEYFLHSTSKNISQFVSGLECFCLSGMKELVKTSHEELLELKAKVAAVILEKLQETARPDVINKMVHKDFDEHITRKYGIIIENWPLRMFCAPRFISSRPELTVLINVWQNNDMQFHRMSDEEFDDWQKVYFEVQKTGTTAATSSSGTQQTSGTAPNTTAQSSTGSLPTTPNPDQDAGTTPDALPFVSPGTIGLPFTDLTAGSSSSTVLFTVTMNVLVQKKPGKERSDKGVKRGENARSRCEGGQRGIVECAAEGSSASEADPNANVSSGRNGDSGAIISSAGEHGPHAGVGVAEVTGKDSGTTDQMEIRPASVGRGGSVDGQNDGDGGTASKDAEELSDHGTVEFVRDVSHGPADRHNIATTQGDGEETNEVILEEAVDKEEVGDARSGQSG
ncbi:hypothetical protein NM688_g4676 [Phlebia brevispora]|uniref:Uncharacterized protein n=1 Tax=Phlebia brevispora TaxID=194682 RepID=A0ACC1T291_9APHY|nr:hypothetical protein NM688_g4676 [Phlebia brevispora]